MKKNDVKEGFVNPRDKLHDEVDGVLSGMPNELQSVTDNLKFIKKIKDDPVTSGVGEHKSFGYQTWDINMILKDNIWNRSIFTVDKLCKMFLKADLETKKKYLKKKNKLGFDYGWLIILILLGIGGLVLVIMYVLPRVLNAL